MFLLRFPLEFQVLGSDLEIVGKVTINSSRLENDAKKRVKPIEISVYMYQYKDKKGCQV